MKLVVHTDSLEWWFWPIIFVFLVLGMFGWVKAFYIAILISAFQSIHYIAKDKGLRSFPSQVCFVYLLFTIIGLFDPTRIWYGLMTVSTFMAAFFDRCLLARILILLPWNKDVKPGWK